MDHSDLLDDQNEETQQPQRWRCCYFPMIHYELHSKV
jgi:hypothetical protein